MTLESNNISDHEDTIFSKIIRGEIPADKVFEDEEFLAFKDINPQAPVHILVIPKTPLPSLDHMTEEHITMMGKLMLTVKKVANEQGLNAYRCRINTGSEAGQTVFHLHVHIMGGMKMSE